MRKSFQLALAPLVIAAVTACSAQGGAGQSAESVALVEESRDKDAGMDEKGELADENSQEKETGDSAADYDMMVITSMEGEASSRDTAPSDAKGVPLSLKDGLLYLDEEVLAAQSGVGKTASGKPAPDFVVKIKPGPIGSYHFVEVDEPNTSNFYMSYYNQEGNMKSRFTLFNHYMTAEDFRLSNEDDNPVTSSDGTLMTIDEYVVNGTSQGITDALIFDPDLGGIRVTFDCTGDAEKFQARETAWN